MYRLFAVLLFLMAFVPAAAAAQETVLVMDIASDEAYREQAALVTERLRAEIAAVPGWEVSPTRTTLDAARQAYGCREQFRDPECLTGIARAAGVSHLVFGQIRPRSDSPGEFSIQLQRWEVASGRYAGSAFRSIVIETEGAQEEIIARIQIILGEDDLGVTPGEPARQVSMNDGQQAASGDRNLFWGLGIGSYAIAGVWVVAMIASSVRIGDIQHDMAYATYRGRVPPGTTNVCDEAAAGNGWTYDEAAVRSLCGEAATLEVLQFVFLGAAAAFVGLGTAFLLFEPGTEQQPAVSITPSLGPDRASIAISGRF